MVDSNRVEISEVELEDLLNQNQGVIRVRNRIISASVIVFLNRPCQKFYFFDCEFTNDIWFYPIDKSEISLNQCLCVNEVKIISENEIVQPALISIYNSKIEELIIESTNVDKIDLSHSKFDYLEIKDVEVFVADLKLTNCSIDKSINFSKVKSSMDISFMWVNIVDDLNIENCNFKSFKSQQTNINGNLYFLNNQIDIDIDRFRVEGEGWYENIDCKKIFINNSDFIKPVRFFYNKEWNPNSVLTLQNRSKNYLIDLIEISSSKFESGISFELEDWDDIQLLSVNEIKIFCSSSSNGDVTFTNIDMSVCTMNGVNRNGTFIFNSCFVLEQFMFYRFINSGKVIFNGKTFKNSTQLFFQESILGAVNFIGVDFSIINCMNFYDSDISNINFASTEWMTEVGKFNLKQELPPVDIFSGQVFSRNISNLISIKDDELLFYKNRRELFRQLKNVSEKQNDRIQALKFQELEMVAYRKCIRLNKIQNSRSDIIILALEWTNEFGQNWVRPVKFAVVITGILSFPIMFGLDKDIFFTLDCKEWCNGIGITFYRWIELFPQLLNPLHSLDKMTNHADSILPFTWWLDYFQKLVMAFFIAQTISAFRKYVKK